MGMEDHQPGPVTIIPPLIQSFQFPPDYSRPEILLALRHESMGDQPAAPSRWQDL